MSEIREKPVRDIDRAARNVPQRDAESDSGRWQMQAWFEPGPFPR